MKPALFNRQKANGEAFIFERTDWHYVLNTFCFGYRVGYKFGGSNTGVCNGNLLETGADACHTSVLVEKSAPMGLLISNGEFVAMDDENPMVVGAGNEGNTTFSNCAFWGHCNQKAIIDGRRTATFSDCIFMQWDHNREGRNAIRAIGGYVIIRGCNFMTDSPQIFIGEKVSRAVVTGNIVRGKVRIDDQSGNAVVKDNHGSE
jgi:hypothetical protein